MSQGSSRSASVSSLSRAPQWCKERVTVLPPQTPFWGHSKNESVPSNQREQAFQISEPQGCGATPASRRAAQSPTRSLQHNLRPSDSLKALAGLGQLDTPKALEADCSPPWPRDLVASTVVLTASGFTVTFPK